MCRSWKIVCRLKIVTGWAARRGMGWNSTHLLFSSLSLQLTAFSAPKCLQMVMFHPSSLSSRVLNDFRDKLAKLRYSHNKHNIISSQTFSSDFISNNAQIFLNHGWKKKSEDSMSYLDMMNILTGTRSRLSSSSINSYSNFSWFYVTIVLYELLLKIFECLLVL